MDELLGHLQHAGVIAGVVNAAVGSGVRKFFSAYVIALPHEVGGNAELMRAEIHHAFQKPKMLHARVTAVGANGAFVADRLGEINARILEAIDAGKNLRPDDAAERLVARISAAIIDMA